MALRTTFLFVLLLFSISLPDVPAQVQKLCGDNFISEALKVCGERGFHAPSLRDITMETGKFKINEHFKAKRSKNVINKATDCCDKGCDYDDIAEFCNAA